MSETKIEYPRICKGCMEIIRTPLEMGDEKKGWCDYCNREETAKVCLNCGKNKPLKLYWGKCQECWDKSTKE